MGFSPGLMDEATKETTGVTRRTAKALSHGQTDAYMLVNGRLESSMDGARTRTPRRARRKEYGKKGSVFNGSLESLPKSCVVLMKTHFRGKCAHFWTGCPPVYHRNVANPTWL